MYAVDRAVEVSKGGFCSVMGQNQLIIIIMMMSVNFYYVL